MKNEPDLAAYVIAAVTMIPLGVVLRTPILNFLCGPAYVVLMVTVIVPYFRRRFGGRSS